MTRDCADMPERFAEQRRFPRARRLRQALCVFNNGASSLDVTVRDVSARGARVVGDGLVSAEDLRAEIHEGDGIYSAQPARLVWTDGRTGGVEFVA